MAILNIPAEIPTEKTDGMIKHGEMKRPRRADRRKKPAPLPNVAIYYRKSESKYQEMIRISFDDGHTEVYDMRVNQPRPDAYVNYPRRKKK